MGEASLSEGLVAVLAVGVGVFEAAASGGSGLQAASSANARISGIFLASINVHPLRRAAKVYSSPAMCPVVTPHLAVPASCWA
ncbi:hypothetical protein XhhCFBP4925_09995 [Xanthomonas hortorum pv. hederae]|nr:hypothetical protein XhhCFBP4925_09995 [Xanthomonas hortorum pv. hederae]PUE99972.1 hypothetical protein C7T87_11190 [Xanthomonas hortorum pv. hederae]